ncbi:MAG: 2-hydroxychromene-2-carboxylate isomerase [Pseudomonadota bacterium]
MSKTVEFCFDVISPASYIAWHVLPKIAKAAGADLVLTPVFLGGIMQAVDNRPPGTVKAKGAWMRRDLTRWASLYGLPYRRNDTFPQNTLHLMRGCVAFADRPMLQAYVDAAFKALHVDNRNVQTPEGMVAVLQAAGIAPDTFQAAIQDPTVKDKLKANTEDAVARGAFGAPTFFVNGELQFGQDRLWMVAEDLGVNIHAALERA